MMLLTKEILKRLPVLYANEKRPLDEVILQVKFFTPDSDFTWFASEFDGKDTFYGVVHSGMCPEGEWGYFSLSEIQSVRGKLGLPVERDRHWGPRPWVVLKKDFSV